MRIDRDQYAELVEKYADELVYDVMEKEAAGFGAVKNTLGSAGSAVSSAARKTKDGISNKALAAKNYTDLISGRSIRQSEKSTTKAINDFKQYRSNPTRDAAEASIKNTGKIRQDTKRAQDKAKYAGKVVGSSAAGGAVGTGVAVAGMQGYNHYQSKKAAELLIEAVMYKHAAFNYMNESELVAEASERALNAMGYSL